MARRAAIPAVILAVLGVVGGALAGDQLSSANTATATATILISPLEGNAFRPGDKGEDLVNLTTEALVARSDKVATLAAEQVPGATPAGLVKELEATALPNTQILEIVFRDADEQRALAGATAFAESFLSYREGRARQSIDEQLALLAEQQSTNDDELTALTDKLAATEPNSAQAALLTARIQAVATQISQLSTQVSQLAATTLNPGQVVTAAAIDPEGPLSPKTMMLGFGLLLGAGAGIAWGYLSARRRQNWLVTGGHDLRHPDRGHDAAPVPDAFTEADSNVFPLPTEALLSDKPTGEDGDLHGRHTPSDDGREAAADQESAADDADVDHGDQHGDADVDEAVDALFDEPLYESRDEDPDVARAKAPASRASRDA